MVEQTRPDDEPLPPAGQAAQEVVRNEYELLVDENLDDVNDAPHQSRLQRTLSLITSPLHDESGSARSVSAGLCSLFVIGTAIGLVLPKNLALPSPWYRDSLWGVSLKPSFILYFPHKPSILAYLQDL